MNAGAGPVDARAALPVELTSFVGRRRELSELHTLLDRSRLVTITGAAGSGKTRLALELVSSRTDARTPVWVELASLRDPGLIAPAVAEAAGLREEVRSGDVQTVARLLHGRPLLLVLDNCEHLVDACAVTADALVRGCPDLVILATSREALGVRGERAWLLPPMTVPDGGSVEAAAASEAVSLFVERAADIVPGFGLTPENAPLIAEICRRLDGIPLAVELAAARVKVLALADMRDRLDDVFRLLGGGGRTALPRHRTLRAAIDWSHELLPDDARTLLRRVSVFRGGFLLEAAERVGAGDTIDSGEVLDVLAGLVDRSLVAVREQHGATRYFLLEAVRQYAAKMLADSGEELATRQRFVGWIEGEVEEAEPHFTRQTRPLHVDRLYPELDNIRSALTWTHDHDPARHVRLVGMLWWFWFSTQHWTEAGRWTDGALALPQAEARTRERAALLFAAGALAALQARPDVARPPLFEAAAIAAELGDGRQEAYALNYLGMTYAGEGNLAALDLCRRAADWFREHDDLYGLRLALLLQGSTAVGAGDLGAAERHNTEGLQVARRFGQPRELGVALQNLAVVHLTQGRLEEAEVLVREAMAAFGRDPSYYFMAIAISYLAEIYGRRGRTLEALQLFGCADATREVVGARPFGLDRGRHEALMEELRTRTDAAAFDAAWQAGRRMQPRLVLSEEAREAEDAAASPIPQLHVRAFGPLAVRVAGHPVEPDRWSYSKPRELFAFLLLNPRGATRDQIGEALWPGAARASVKNNFHVTLHHLRKALERPEWIVREADRYRFSPAVVTSFDARLFEDVARSALRLSGAGASPDAVAALRHAHALYTGELLEGENCGRWLDEHRDRLHRLFMDVSLALGAALEAGDPEAAVALYEAAAERDELNEELHRRLMGIWAGAGHRARALRHYERLVSLLNDILDAEPEPETTELYDRIRSGAG
ncbi:MAG TPA: BTAD domain-containing putative transcriptional regulator [Longimicrobiales bacterium]|nr:BTAD domain-containing putative transcriptional regulator [Longimicrobiales bacterium]